MAGNDKRNFISLYILIGISITIVLISLLTKHSQNSAVFFLINPLILITGLVFTRASLRFYFEEKIVSITLILIVLATNVFFIGVFSNCFQQILLFTLYSILVYLTIRWHQEPFILVALFIGLVAGLIMMFQPTGFFALLIPILWNISDKASWKGKNQLIRRNWSHILVFILSVILINIIALITLNIRPGEISFLDIKLPGVFIFGSRYLWNYLFSFDHGLFIYSPVFILAVIGFYFTAEKNRSIFFPVFIFCILDLLCETCWSDLGETHVFGQIAFIPAYALIVFPIASFITSVFSGRLISKIGILLVSTVFLLLNLFQTWQFNQGIILPAGMTMSRYGETYTWIEHMNPDDLLLVNGVNPIADDEFDGNGQLTKIKLAYNDFEDTNVYYKSRLESKIVKSGKMAFTLDSSVRYSPSWEMTYKEFMKKKLRGVRITVSVFASDYQALAGTNLVITSEHSGKLYGYRTLTLGNLKLNPGIWNTVSMNYVPPDKPNLSDKIVSCVYFTGNSKTYIDDLKFEAFVQN